jgi:uncharacterized small protein (DUF1192 family)
MTWTPPPESERPDEYTCLAYISTKYCDEGWTEVVWRKRRNMWWAPILADSSLLQPYFRDHDAADFAPLPEVGERVAPTPAEIDARVAELQAEVARLRKAGGLKQILVTIRVDAAEGIAAAQAEIDRFLNQETPHD